MMNRTALFAAVCLFSMLTAAAIAHPGHEPLAEGTTASLEHLLSSPYHLLMLLAAVAIPAGLAAWLLRSARRTQSHHRR